MFTIYLHGICICCVLLTEVSSNILLIIVSTILLLTMVSIVYPTIKHSNIQHVIFECSIIIFPNIKVNMSNII